MNARFAMLASAAIGQFLLVLTPGLLRAMLQAPAHSVLPHELLPVPAVLALGALLSYGFLRSSRQAEQDLRAEEENRIARRLKLLRNGPPEPVWTSWLERRILLRDTFPVLAIRLLLVLFFMFVEDWRAGLAGTMMAALGALVLPWAFKAREKRSLEERLELWRVLLLSVFPALVAFLLLFDTTTGPASIAALFLFAGLLLEISIQFEQWLRAWGAHALPPAECARLAELDCALATVERLPAGRVAFVAEGAPAAGNPYAEHGATLWLVPSESAARSSVHFVWRNRRIEVLA